MTMPFDLQSYLIPGTLALTLLGSLAALLASDRMSRQVALVLSAPAVATTSVMLWQVGIGDGGTYSFTAQWEWVPALGRMAARLMKSGSRLPSVLF